MLSRSDGNGALRIARAIRLGLPIEDREFDALLPSTLQRISRRYWTPLTVVQVVVDWLRPESIEHILDIGSGAGKFCIAGALGSAVHFVGIEQRAHLFEAACGLAGRLGAADRTTFLHGCVSSTDIERFDAVYMFNPFGENLFEKDDRLDDTAELGEARFGRDIAIVESALDRMRRGSLLFTYHGFGGRIPDSFVLARAAVTGSDVVRMWRKVSRESGGGYWLELERRVFHVDASK